MQTHNITTLAQFDNLLHMEQTYVNNCRDQFYEALAELAPNRTFTEPDWEPAKARKIFAAALQARGEYRQYLLDKCNEALYCNANDAHIGGPVVTIA